MDASLKVPFLKKNFFLKLNETCQKQLPISGDSASISHSWLSKCPFVKQSCPFIERNSQFQIIIWFNSLRYINKVLLKRRNNLIFVTYFPCWYLMGFIYLSDSSWCKTRACIMKYLASTFSLISLPKILIRTGGKIAKKLSPKIFTNIHFYIQFISAYCSDVSNRILIPVYWYECPNSGTQKTKNLLQKCLQFLLLTTNCSIFDINTNCLLLKPAETFIF